jgi:hypothetical protein
MAPAASIENDVIIRAPRPKPFENLYGLECPKCGHRIHRTMHFFRLALGLAMFTAVDAKYCAGGKPPSETREGVEAMLVGRERNFSCAGIDYPHLHCICTRCSYAWHMATKAGR